MGMDAVATNAEFNDFDMQINLSHFPYKGHEIDDRFLEGQLEDDGNFLLHGHVHSEWKTRNKMINVGVDQWNYAPVSYPELLKEIQRINWGELLIEVDK